MSLGPEHVKMLDGSYSIFGQVTKGLDVAKKIAQGDKIQSIDVVDSTAALFTAQEARLKEWNKTLDKKFGNRLASSDRKAGLGWCRCGVDKRKLQRMIHRLSSVSPGKG